jgi:hypothetical protein
MSWASSGWDVPTFRELCDWRIQIHPLEGVRGSGPLPLTRKELDGIRCGCHGVGSRLVLVRGKEGGKSRCDAMRSDAERWDAVGAACPQWVRGVRVQVPVPKASYSLSKARSAQ